MRISDWSSDVSSSHLTLQGNLPAATHHLPTTADGLPAVLTPHDADLYRRIFVLQEDGRWPQADRLIAGLSDKRLLGHLLAQRYLHPTAYRSKRSEEHTSELQSLMRISYAVFCLK